MLNPVLFFSIVLTLLPRPHQRVYPSRDQFYFLHKTKASMQKIINKNYYFEKIICWAIIFITRIFNTTKVMPCIFFIENHYGSSKQTHLLYTDRYRLLVFSEALSPSFLPLNRNDMIVVIIGAAITT